MDLIVKIYIALTIIMPYIYLHHSYNKYLIHSTYNDGITFKNRY